MKSSRLTSLILAFTLLPILHGNAEAQQVYKWTDPSGQVHYGQKKPDDAARVQTLDIAPPPPSAPSSADPSAEIARINALSDQMARERQAAEKARQEQATRDLEQENQRLQNDLLNQQLQQQKQNQEDDGDNVIIGYPPPYPYPPYPYPPYPLPPPYPPHPGPPCQPWPTCHKPAPPLRPPEPLAKPNPPFRPAPAGIAPESQGVFRGR